MSDGAERGTSDRSKAVGDKDETEPVESRPPLFVVKGDATAEEVAALVAVLQGMAAADTPPAPTPRPEWSANHRKARPSLQAGPGGWRSSAMPR